MSLYILLNQSERVYIPTTRLFLIPCPALFNFAENRVAHFLLVANEASACNYRNAAALAELRTVNGTLREYLAARANCCVILPFVPSNNEMMQSTFIFCDIHIKERILIMCLLLQNSPMN
jgi:hypothetical protein